MFHNLIPFSRVTRVVSMGHRLCFIAIFAGLFGTLGACGQNTDESRSTRRAIAQSQAIAADFLRTELALSPETASQLDLERYLSPNANYALDNHSQAGFERRRLVRIELLQRLQSRPALPDEHPLTRDLLVAERALVDLISLEQLGYGRFDYAEFRPYAIDPYSGIWIEGPSLLAFRQSITNADQATAYLARLRALSLAIADTKRRLIADQASGILLPRALALETQTRLTRLLEDEFNGLNRLSDTFNALTASVPDLDAEQRERLSNLVRLEVSDRLRPAYLELIATLDESMDETADQAGIWAQPRGQDLYAGILIASLGEPSGIERLHENHILAAAEQREDVTQILVSADTAVPPPPAEARLSNQFEQYELAALANAPPTAIIAVADQEDTLMDLSPKSDWQRVATQPSFDAQAKAVQTFLLLWETEPYQLWLSDGGESRTPHRVLTEYTAIQAAWQLYVWRRSAAMTDAAGTGLSLLAGQSISLIHSVLAAADTGIHLERWTIAEATAYIAENSGLSEPLARQLALSISARPGFHSAVNIAWQRFESLSERAKAVLGERYSEIEFQKTLIEPGPRPLALIEKDIEAWYGARLAGGAAN